MIVVDSSVWIDLFRAKKTRQTDWIRDGSNREEIAVLDLILCEVLQGTPDVARFNRTRSLLSRFTLTSADPIGLAIRSAQNYRILRERGFTIRSTIDCVIATFCIEHAHMLLHTDRDFDIFERELGLRIFRP